MSQIGVCEKKSGKSDDNGSELEFTRFRGFKWREKRKEETSCETGEVGKKKNSQTIVEWNSISVEVRVVQKRNKEQENDNAKQSETTRTEIERRVERNECTFLGRPLEEINNRESDPFVCVNLNSQEKERGKKRRRHQTSSEGSGQCEKRRKSCWRLNLVKMNRRRSLRMQGRMPRKKANKRRRRKRRLSVFVSCFSADDVEFFRTAFAREDWSTDWIVQEGLVIGVLVFCCCWFDMVQAQQGSSSECGNGSGNGIGSWVWIFYWSGINCRSTWFWFDF